MGEFRRAQANVLSSGTTVSVSLRYLILLAALGLGPVNAVYSYYLTGP